MELQKKFDKWLEDEKFVTFANKRLKDEILHVPENHLLDPKHEELEEGLRITTVMQLLGDIPDLLFATGQMQQEC